MKRSTDLSTKSGQIEALEKENTVDHTVLLSKSSAYGIQENAYNWFKSYLENRTQTCSVSGSLFKTCSLQCGIPQGAVLGPLFFLLYINDLPNCLTNSYSRMYTDDTNLNYADKDVKCEYHSVPFEYRFAKYLQMADR